MTIASRVAVEVAERLGLSVDQPVLIQQTDNTVLWLRPHAIIAKVATRRDSVEAAIREHRVATELGQLGAAVALPVPEIPPVRHPATGFLVTLWQRLEHDPNTRLPEMAVGRSLGHLHDALAVCDVPLPSFRVSLERARHRSAGGRRYARVEYVVVPSQHITTGPRVMGTGGPPPGDPQLRHLAVSANAAKISKTAPYLAEQHKRLIPFVW